MSEMAVRVQRGRIEGRQDVATKVVPGPGSTRGPVEFSRFGFTRNQRAEMRFYTKRGNRGTVSFKMTHIEAKSIYIWLIYDLFWLIWLVQTNMGLRLAFYTA